MLVGKLYYSFITSGIKQVFLSYKHQKYFSGLPLKLNGNWPDILIHSSSQLCVSLSVIIGYINCLIQTRKKIEKNCNCSEKHVKHESKAGDFARFS